MTKADRWFVWTDFGGVLTPPISGAFKEFCRKHELDPAALSEAMAKVAQNHNVADALELLDRPILTEMEWIAEINTHLDRKLMMTTLADAWFDGRKANEDWAHVLREIRSQDIGVGMLSNMVPSWDTYWRRMIDPSGLFDQVMLSFEEGFRKPEPGIYAAAARRAGVSADRCILVDDLEANCAGAISAGWRAVHFRDAASAKEELLQILQGNTSSEKITSKATMKGTKMADWQTPIQKMMADVPAEIRDVAMGVGMVFSSLDRDAAEKYIHADFVDHEASEGIGGGPEGYLATARYMNNAFSDATWMPLTIMATGDKYAMAMEFSGVHSGEFLGIQPTGKKVSIRHLHFFRVQDGKAIEHWGARDELTLLAQIGVFTPDIANPADAGAVARYA